MLKSAYEQLGMPAAFSGVNNLQRVIGKKTKQLQKELESVNTYTICLLYTSPSPRDRG